MATDFLDFAVAILNQPHSDEVKTLYEEVKSSFSNFLKKKNKPIKIRKTFQTIRWDNTVNIS